VIPISTALRWNHSYRNGIDCLTGQEQRFRLRSCSKSDSLQSGVTPRPIIFFDSSATSVPTCSGRGLISTTDSSGNQTYYLKDGLGNTVALCNGSSTVTATYSYDVYGAVRSHTGGSTEFTFTSEQNDPNGLEYLRARYYDNATGRFLSGDPLGSGYGYAGANPANRVDPRGLYWIPCGDVAECIWSEDVGLPAEPPIDCDLSLNICVWQSGVIFPYEDGVGLGQIGDCGTLSAVACLAVIQQMFGNYCGSPASGQSPSQCASAVNAARQVCQIGGACDSRACVPLDVDCNSTITWYERLQYCNVDTNPFEDDCGPVVHIVCSFVKCNNDTTPIGIFGGQKPGLPRNAPGWICSPITGTCYLF
jgi:RHS repeat-associated protein